MLNKIILIGLVFIGACLSSCKRKSQNADHEYKEGVIQKTEIEKLPYFNTSDFTPTWLSSNDELKEFHKIPNFNFTNQLGQKVTNTSLEGKIYVASFFFTTCPNICLQLTKNMRELQNIYLEEEDIKLISHTVLPNIDTVEVLKAFGERQNIDPKKWYLVTGEKEKIYELAREAYFADDLFKQTNDKNRFIHTENIILIDKNSHIRGVYNGTLSTEVKRIQRHIEMLKKE